MRQCKVGQNTLGYCLDYLKTLGLVSRYKVHPFATSEEDLGWEIRPDSMAETGSENYCVIEIKPVGSSRKLFEPSSMRIAKA